MAEARRRGEARRTAKVRDLTASIRLHWRAAGWFLDVIERYRADMELLGLQAVTVDKQTGVPVQGYPGNRGRRAHARGVKLVRA